LGYFGHGSYTGLVKQISGETEHTFVFDGKGLWTAIADDECRFVGDWHNGKRHGNGVMTK